MATFTCESMPIVSQVDGEGPSDLQAAASNVPVCTDEAPQDRIQAEPQIDKLLLDGLAVAKDRLLLLRADLEMEKLFNDLA